MRSFPYSLLIDAASLLEADADNINPLLGIEIPVIEPTLPFFTETAALVWEEAKKLVRVFPHSAAGELIQQAINRSGVEPFHLTAEDTRLLEMGIEALRGGVSLDLQPFPKMPGSEIASAHWSGIGRYNGTLGSNGM